MLILLSIFIFGNQIRYGIRPILYQVNVLYIIALIVLFSKCGYALNKNRFVLWAFLSIQAVFVNLMNGCTGAEIFRNFMIMYCPLLLLYFDFAKVRKDSRITVRKLVSTYNFFVYVQLAIYFLDAFLNGAVMKLLAATIAPKIEQYLLYSKFGLFSYRFSSYLGQSLFVAEVFLIYLIVNLYYNKCSETPLVNRYLLYTIAVLGALITASRTCTFLVATIIVIDLFFEKHKVISIVTVMLLFGLIQYLGVFEVLLGRATAVSLTSGRNEAWELLRGMSGLNLHLLWGSGMKTHEIWSGLIGSSKASNAFEYPSLTLFYRIGIVPAVVWIWMTFIKPAIALARRKDFYGLFLLIMLIIEVNTFNGISEVSDLLLLYSFTVQIFLILVFAKNCEDINGISL